MKRSFFLASLIVLITGFLFMTPVQEASALEGTIIFTPTDMHFEVAAPGLPTVFNVERLILSGIEYRNTSDNAPPAGLSPGDTARIDGVFGVASFISGNSQVIPPGFNLFWELTGTYVALTDTIISVSGSALTYISTPGVGIVTLYVGTDMAQQANFLTGDGFDDGIPVAQFIVQDGGGSYLIAGALDGSRDFFMQKDSGLPGFFVPDIEVGSFDSNLDADQDNNGVGGDFPVPTSWNYPVASPMVMFPWSFFTSTDGSMRFGELLTVCGDGFVGNIPGETCDPPTGYCTGITVPRTPCQSDTDCPDGETCGGLVSPVGGGDADRICRNGTGTTPPACTYCGDGVVQTDAGETCDDGNDIDEDACNNVCQPNNCDVKVDKAVDCGSGAVDNTLVKNNEDGTNGCTAYVNDLLTVTYRVQNTGSVPLFNCVLTDSNGNISGPISGVDVGVGQTITLEPINLICTDQLDDREPDTLTVQCDCGDPAQPFGTTSASDTAKFSCEPKCGDGNLDPGEFCDPGDPDANIPPIFPPGSPPDRICRDNCTYCGDGVVNNGEQCDDGNSDNNDGCRNDCTVPQVCGTGTPGYWKNHPEAWPVNSIVIGGTTYSKTVAIGIMGWSDGNKCVTMFRSLTAAKLNLLNGCAGTCVTSTINAAEVWMATWCDDMYTDKVKASSDAWKAGEPLYFTLDRYNNGRLCDPSRDYMGDGHPTLCPPPGWPYDGGTTPPPPDDGGSSGGGGGGKKKK